MQPHNERHSGTHHVNQTPQVVVKGAGEQHREKAQLGVVARHIAERTEALSVHVYHCNSLAIQVHKLGLAPEPYATCEALRVGPLSVLRGDLTLRHKPHGQLYLNPVSNPEA